MYVVRQSTVYRVVRPVRPSRIGLNLACLLLLGVAVVVAIGAVRMLNDRPAEVVQVGAAASSELGGALSQPGVCVFQVSASTEIIVSPNSFCEEGTVDTVKGTAPGSNIGPFRVSASDAVGATSVGCSLTRPTDGKHLWVATDGSVSATGVCAALAGIGWQ
jgi:hypothetical protein